MSKHDHLDEILLYLAEATVFTRGIDMGPARTRELGLHIGELNTQLIDERERIRKAVEALVKYGRHYLNCDVRFRNDCTCGFADILKELDQ